MSQWPIPSDREQLQFLKNIQRLLDEGSFVASYKFALLHSLADLAVTEGDDSGAPLPLSTRQISEQFIKLYWQQVRPFRNADTVNGVLLKQNAGKQASVVTHLHRAHSSVAGSLFRMQQETRAWRKLVSDVDSTVRMMPLWKLQTVGNERIEFLYANQDRGGVIELKPGVAYCMRTFHPMLCGLFRAAWIDFLRHANASELGAGDDLQEFLFGHERGSLDVYKPILFEVQSGECFYCNREMREGGDIDHFIPWSRCHSDLAHNFVLAHRGCNNAKSDHLAFEKHLEAWVERNTSRRDELEQRYSVSAVVHDANTSARIATWAYSCAEQSHGQVWIRGKEFKHLDDSWREFLWVAAAS
jgi:hypothetical protein